MFVRKNLEKDCSPMKIAICDDNFASVDRLCKMIMNYFALVDKDCECLTFHSPEGLLNADLSSIHIVFLDIDMPNINGIDAATTLRSNYPNVFIVFVTSWIEYAPAGYHVNAFRYLLKQRLESELSPCLDAIRDTLVRSQEQIQLPGKDHPIEAVLDEISFIEGSSTRSIKLHFLTKAPIDCRGKLTDISEQLKSKGFLKIQRSYVVNMRHLLQIKGYKAVLRDGTELKVSERDYSIICKQYYLWKGQQL